MFGLGVISWLVLGSIILGRLFVQAPGRAGTLNLIMSFPVLTRGRGGG
jgi:hypothetical protein